MYARSTSLFFNSLIVLCKETVPGRNLLGFLIPPGPVGAPLRAAFVVSRFLGWLSRLRLALLAFRRVPPRRLYLLGED